MKGSAAALLAALILGGCAGTLEPWEREGAWRATGANDANLRAMVVDPAHLTRGAQPAVASRGEAAARSTGRLGFPAAPPQGVTAGPGVPNLPPLRTSDVGN